MKKFFAGVSIVIAVLLLMWGAPLIVDATTSTVVTGDMATGTVTGTGAAINVSLGWTPRVVLISNPSTTNPTVVYWHTSMGSAKGLKTVVTGTTPAVSYLSSLGVSSYTGSTTAGKGFTIGADTDLNITGDTLMYEAHK